MGWVGWQGVMSPLELPGLSFDYLLFCLPCEAPGVDGWVDSRASVRVALNLADAFCCLGCCAGRYGCEVRVKSEDERKMDGCMGGRINAWAACSLAPVSTLKLPGLKVV